MDFDKELDARGINCPLPLLRARKALSLMHAGRVLKIVATDSCTVRDFDVFTKHTGNELVGSEIVNREFVFFIRKH